MNLLVQRIVAATMLVATGCSLLGKPKDAPIVYAPRLTWSASAITAPPVDFQLLIDAPQTSAALDSNRIAVMPTSRILQVYKKSHWPDRVPLLLRNLLTEAFERSGRITGVGNYATGLRVDYSLVTQIQDFQAEYREGFPVAVLRISAKLVDALSGQVLAVHVFSAEQRSEATTIAEVVRAFEIALNSLLPQIVDWTLNEGARARAIKDLNP